MLSFPPSVRVFIARQPVDGRKGADGLVTLIRSVFAQDPLDGHLHVFFSRRVDRVRIVYWDRDGFALWSKRLEMGRFRVRFDASGRLCCETVEFAELMLILQGIDLEGARRRPRWVPRDNRAKSDNAPMETAILLPPRD